MARVQTGLREEKKAKTRQRIIDVTVELIRAVGYEKTTIEDVLRRVGISAPTFYKNYFASKDDVLRAVARELLEKDVLLAEQRPRRAISAARRLRNVYALIAQEMAADRELCRALVLADAMNIYRIRELAETERRWSRALEAILADGQRQGEITKRIPASQLALFLDGAQYTALCAWANEYPAAPSIHETLQRGLNVFLGGARLRARK